MSNKSNAIPLIKKNKSNAILKYLITILTLECQVMISMPNKKQCNAILKYLITVLIAHKTIIIVISR